MLRLIKILLVLSVAMWALIGAYANIMDWDGTTGAVAATTSMATFEGGAESWQATSSPALVMAGAAFIFTLKVIAGLLCLAGVLRMSAARDAAAFEQAKKMALAGCGVAVFMLFTGWIVIAETWYELWRSDALRDIGLGAAFRYCGMIGLIALFVGSREE